MKKRENKKMHTPIGMDGRKECLLCGDECESVSHVL